MRELLSEDLEWVVRRLPSAVRKVAEQRSDLLVIIAGGFIRAVIAGEQVNDVDIFTSSLTQARDLAIAINGGFSADASAFVETANAITVRSTNPVTQIIHRWTFNTIAECIESFDFTIARAGVTYSSGRRWQSACDNNFYEDLAAKRLRYMRPDRREDEAGSMLRLLKFYSKGYRAPLWSIGAVIARAVKGVAPEAEHLMADSVTKRLRVVDPAVDPEQEGHLG